MVYSRAVEEEESLEHLEREELARLIEREEVASLIEMEEVARLIEDLENKIMFVIKIGNINDNQSTQSLASIRVQRIFLMSSLHCSQYKLIKVQQ